MEIWHRCPGCKRDTCNGCGIYSKLNTNKQIPISFPAGFLPQQGKGYGISFDVGTTTIAGMLWNLKTGKLLNVEAMKNPQTHIGADVISRIQYAMQAPEHGRRLQEMIVMSLDEMAERLLGEQQELPIEKVTVVGNTAMCELLMGICPKGLAVAPFTPDYATVVCEQGQTFGFQVLKNAEIVILPPCGGYVGADALAVNHCVTLYAKAPTAEKTERKAVMAIDIGTNGEIILQIGDRQLACSTAAGPALEGGAIHYGMCASKGAIDKVAVTGCFPMQDIAVRSIGTGEAKGICGSGIIDATAVLYRLGILDNTGYMHTAKEAKEAGVPDKICQRIENTAQGSRFLLTDSQHPVYLSADDIRQVQLAVGAIRTGMELLLAKADVCMEHISELMIAGAFGSYIDIASGKAIGLFPNIPDEKIRQTGNLASTGAAMALLSEEELGRMEREGRQMVHMELAEEKGFQEQFMQYMNFPLLF